MRWMGASPVSIALVLMGRDIVKDEELTETDGNLIQ